MENNNKSLFQCFYAFPLGTIHLTASDRGLKSLAFITSGPLPCYSQQSHPVLAETLFWLRHYFQGDKPPALDVPLVPEGTPFQKNVWQAVRGIGYGSVSSYGQIAKILNTHSARAVGQAIGRNPLAVIIPCHRVLMSNGKICGYAWGVPFKLWLLRHEGIDI